MDWSEQQAKYGALVQPRATTQPRTQPKKNSRKSWLSALPSLAAAGASFIPGVGTIGGAALGGLGELGRQALSDEKIDLGKAGREAAISAIPGALGKVGKFALGGTRAAKVARLANEAEDVAQFGKAAKGIAVKDVSSITRGSIGAKIPGTANKAVDSLDEFDFISRFKPAATEAAKNTPGIYKTISKDTKDPLNLVVNHLATNATKGETRGIVNRLFSEGLDGNTRNRLIKDLNKAQTPEEVKRLLTQTEKGVRTQQVGAIRPKELDVSFGGEPTTKITTLPAKKQQQLALEPKSRSLLSRVASRSASSDESLLAKAGQKVRASNRGIQAGDKIGKEVLDEIRAKDINTAISGANKGLTGKTVRGQVKGVQQARQAATEELNAAAKASKGVVSGETKAKIAKGVESDRSKILTFDPANKSHVSLNNRYATRLDSAKSADEILEARRVFGQAAKKVYTNPDATQTLDKELASVYYKHANKMLDDLAPEIRAADKKVSTLIDAEKALTSSKSKVTASGIKPFGTSVNGRGIGGGTLQAATDTTGKVLEAVGSNKAVPKFARGLTGQVAARAVATPVLQPADATALDTTSIAPVEGEATPVGTTIPTASATPESTGIGPDSDKINQALQAALIQALGKGDYQGITAIKSVMDVFAKQEVKPVKKTEGQRARDEAAQLTEQAIEQLSAGGVSTGLIGGNLEKVKGTFGVADQPTLDFNTTISNLKASITKARAGTAVSAQEKKLLDQYTPRVGDSGQQIRTKLRLLQGVYQQAAEREYGTEYQPDQLVPQAV